MASRWKRASPALLAGGLATMGVLHFATPKPFVKIIPSWLPAPEALVAASGAAELACAALVAIPKTRGLGGLATAALFVGVFPANCQMALDARTTPSKAIAYGRLPLQVPLVAWALSVSRRGAGRPARC
ncbi:hypothetical protein [Cryptosporangium sp. NPDC051539]|uniref:hypothetical protein n=1 Tax=Cryptosporangium sp. NPDC051539 TaxID=3363962 RepID=UPI0037BDD138